MSRNSLVLSIAALGISIALLHILAIEFYLYWTLVWFDIPMHFLGGLFVGVIAVWFFYSHDRFVLPSWLHPLVAIVGSALIVGVLWEVFEFFTGALIAEDLVLDTTLDLVMDVLGGAAAYYLVYLRDD